MFSPGRKPGVAARENPGSPEGAEQSPNAGPETITRDPQNGRITGTTLGGVTDSYQYDALGQLSVYSASYNGSEVFRVEYTRDDIGRISEKRETRYGTTFTEGYGYDTAGRLETVTRNGTLVSQYTYDANGNRLSHWTPDGTDTGSYDDQDRLLTYGDGTYTYTAAGELLTKTDPSGTTTYDYDPLGNLRRVDLSDGTVIEYVIDAQNRRVGRKVNGTLVQGWLYGDQLNPVAETDGAGNIVSRFVYGARSNVPDFMIRGGITYRIISDHLGSVRYVLDPSTGTIMESLDYDEFGNVDLASNAAFGPFGFAGGIVDLDTHLTRFGARDYEAKIGRWTTRDPASFAGIDPDLYAYCMGDPINRVDHDGHFAGVIALFGEAVLTAVVGVLVYEHLKTHPEAWQVPTVSESRGRSTTAPNQARPRPGERYHEPLPKSCDYPIKPGKTVRGADPQKPCEGFLKAAKEATGPERILYMAMYAWCRLNS